MRKFVFALFVTGAGGFLSGSAAADADDPVVAVGADRIFVPTGFDDNDNAQVVLDGLLPNTCYQLAAGSQEIDQVNKVITVEAKAKLTTGNCIDVLVPFSQVFDFGELAFGEWMIRTTDGRLEKKLLVAEATSSGPDDQVYASIDNAYVQDEGPQGYSIVLEGTYTNTCMVWEKTQLIYKDPAVLEILPIVRIVQRPDCENRSFPFKGVKIKLPDVTEGRYLLHVRSMNGEAVNRVFTMGFAGPTTRAQ